MDINKSITDLFQRNGLLLEADAKIPKRKLGKTGYSVGIFSLGGQGSLEARGDEDNAIEIIKRAHELGVNYFDTAPIYGPSEDIYGEALSGIRDGVFLASKTDERDRDGSMKLLEKSLKRLKTDHIDLWQIHHLGTMEEVDEVTGDGGALEALSEAKEQGLVNFLGITGHEDPLVLKEALRRFPFDTVLCSVNAGDKHVKPSFIEELLPAADKDDVGVIGMKVFAQGYIFNKDGIKTKWEPITYALSQDVDTVIIGCDDIAQLEENIAIAKAFKELTEEQQKEIEDKTKDYPEAAQFFRKKFGGYDSRDKLGEPYMV